MSQATITHSNIAIHPAALSGVPPPAGGIGERTHIIDKHFLKHLRGLGEEQWDWKPYPECKSIRETLAHLVWVDRAALISLETDQEPDYTALEEPERDLDRLRGLLTETHERLCAFLTTRYGDAPLDTEVSLFGDRKKLGRAVPYLSAEDFYHSGQVAFIRMATDPTWDYYGFIYGSE